MAIPDYELLARAIGSYNGGLNFWNGLSWPEMLIRTTETPVGERTNHFPASGDGRCSTCTYVLDIFKEYDLPNRTYIWAGTEERQPEEIPLVENGEEVLDEAGDPVMVANPEAGQPYWCFAYGEDEWLDKENWITVQRDAAGTLDEPGVGRVNCETGEAL